MQLTLASGYLGVIILKAGMHYINIDPEKTHNRTSSTVILRIYCNRRRIWQYPKVRMFLNSLLIDIFVFILTLLLAAYQPTSFP
jgi:hypothetical protein